MNPVTKGDSLMSFDALDVSLQLIRSLRSPVEKIQAHDSALAIQIRKAASSISLNLGEGRRRVGRDRTHHFRISAGSAGEVKAALLVAHAWGWIDDDAHMTDALALVERVAAMCWRLTH